MSSKVGFACAFDKGDALKFNAAALIEVLPNL